MEKNHKPSWWVLYLLITIVLIAGGLEARSQLSVLEHKVLEIGGLLLIYALVYVWLKLNTAAIIQEDYERHQGDHQPGAKSINSSTKALPLEASAFFSPLRRANSSILNWFVALASTIISIVTQGR